MDFYRINDPPQDPNDLFNEWMEERNSPPNIGLHPKGPPQMVLATISEDGKRPAARTLLLRGYERNAYKMYFNLDSPKGKQIALNNNGSLVLAWQIVQPNGQGVCHKQVRIEGILKRLPLAEETQYFENQPLFSQIRSVVVVQSSVVEVEDRQKLESEANSLFERVTKENYKIPKPDSYVGFALIPRQMEFFISLEGIGDRVCYYRESSESEVFTECWDEAIDIPSSSWRFEYLAVFFSLSSPTVSEEVKKQLLTKAAELGLDTNNTIQSG